MQMQVFKRKVGLFLILKVPTTDWWRNLTLRNNGFLSDSLVHMRNMIRLMQIQFK
jgi:hypothetical protein